MNEILTWTLIIIAVGLTIQFVVLSLRHENLLREHTRAIRELSSKGERDEPWDFTEKIKGIYKYVQIIAWIGVFFCVCVCLHYLCGYCPREKSLVEADYMGVVVGILAAMITLLVGWNIYSTIKAKDELKETQKEIKDGFEARIKELESQIVKISNHQAKNDGIIEASETSNYWNRIKDVTLGLKEQNEYDKRKIKTPLYKWLWDMCLEHPYDDLTIMVEYQRMATENPKKVAYVYGKILEGAGITRLIEEIRFIQKLTNTGNEKGKTDRIYEDFVSPDTP